VGRRGPELRRGRAPQSGGTPLYVAAQNGHVAVVELLVSKGADMDAPTKVREGRGCWAFKRCLILAGGWSKAAERSRAHEGRRICTPVYSICSADLVNVAIQFTCSHGDVLVNGHNGFTNERVQSPV